MAEEAKAEETKSEAAPATGAAPVPPTFRHILGEKLGMTQIYDGGGKIIPVTAIKAGPCPVTEVRTAERDGYTAVQIGFGKIKEKSLTKADLGRFKKAGVAVQHWVREFRASVAGVSVGQNVTVDGRFKVGDYVDVQGVSKGKGFAGGMKRHGFHGMPASHGASDKERSPGSLASRRALGRVLPGQRMAGHMGHETHTTPHLEIVHVNVEENLLYVRGAVAGPAGTLVSVSETVKPVKHRIIRAPVVAKKKDPLKAAKQAAKGAGVGKKK
jgi:large subunit ribosomal protein L3